MPTPNSSEQEPSPSSFQKMLLAQIRSSAPSLIQKLQSGLFKLPVELIWSTHSHWPLSPSHTAPTKTPIRISVLDSSFNPPTLAHLALANSKRPTYTTTDGDTPDYNAKLLLLSVKNVDKTLKPGDASYLQRLEMMALLAQDVQSASNTSNNGSNVAIAIIDEPTFVRKSSVLQEYFRNRLHSITPDADAAHTQLTFIVGTDTLERLFSPRYYLPPTPGSTADQTMLTALSHMLSPAGDDSAIVCAKRSGSGDATTLPDTQEALANGYTQTLFEWPEASPPLSASATREGAILKQERIVLVDIGDRESKFSSTAVRNARSRADSDSGEGAWREWVTKSVARYIEDEKLYVTP